MSAVRDIMLENPNSVEDALGGSHPSLVFLLGQIHRHSMDENKRLRQKINAMDVAGETLSTIVEAMHGNCDSVESWENACNLPTLSSEKEKA